MTMKTLRFLKTSIVALGLVIAVTSCSKDDNMTGSHIPSSDNSGDKIIGQILDHGLASTSSKGEIRLMMATFDNTGEVTNTSPGEIIGKSTLVNLAFYVNQDEMIPTGEYAFSSDEGKDQFMLGRSFVTYTSGDDQNVQFEKNVAGGSVKVLYDGRIYTFTFDLLLDDGNSLTGTVAGEMEYYDVHD